eukprot:7389329-Prymnesium_polylepis.1
MVGRDCMLIDPFRSPPLGGETTRVTPSDRVTPLFDRRGIISLRRFANGKPEFLTHASLCRSRVTAIPSRTQVTPDPERDAADATAD